MGRNGQWVLPQTSIQFCIKIIVLPQTSIQFCIKIINFFYSIDDFKWKGGCPWLWPVGHPPPPFLPLFLSNSLIYYYEGVRWKLCKNSSLNKHYPPPTVRTITWIQPQPTIPFLVKRAVSKFRKWQGFGNILRSTYTRHIQSFYSRCFTLSPESILLTEIQAHLMDFCCIQMFYGLYKGVQGDWERTKSNTCREAANRHVGK